MEKTESSYTVGGNVNWYSHCGRRYGESLKNLEIKPPFEQTIPLLGINPEETKIEKDTHFPLFITALFTIAKTCKQPRCPLTDEWIKKLWYRWQLMVNHVGFVISEEKKEKKNSFRTNQGPGLITWELLFISFIKLRKGTEKGSDIDIRKGWRVLLC